jgi:large subunit ribosomal protein L35
MRSTHMKLKTSKTAVKRIARITKTGKLLRRKMSAQHLVRNKSQRVRKDARRKLLVAKSDLKKIRFLIPYGR